MKLDILAIAAHPDDVELSCGGTLLSHINKGYKVGILDLTRGELGTRGTAQTRTIEAAEASRILGVHARENVKIPDGFFRNDEEHQRAIIPYIRKYRPTIVLANAIEDRHPDHGRGAELIYDACFLSGLRKIVTQDETGTNQEAWRPTHIYHCIQDRYIKPHFIIDITAHWHTKLEAIKAYRTQFYDPNSTEPNSYISSAEFMDFLEARAREYGHSIGVKYGEGFTVCRIPAIDDLFDLK
jgi:N-acetylglucosamine malate deacetylase 1